jgi:hypothetical protein
MEETVVYQASSSIVSNGKKEEYQKETRHMIKLKDA